MKPLGPVLHELLYFLEEGRGFRIVRGILFFGFVVIVMVLYAHANFCGLRLAEAMDYAQLGRNLAMGRGYVTRRLHPVALDYLAQRQGRRNIEPHVFPELIKPPVYPLLLAVALHLGQVESDPLSAVDSRETKIVAPLNLAFLLATGVLVLLIGRCLFSAYTATLATAVFFLGDAVLAGSLAGTGLPVAAFFCTAGFFLTLCATRVKDGHRFAEPKRFVLVLCAALCAALAFLTRYAALSAAVALLAAVLLMGGKRRWWWAVLFIGVFLAAATPWLMRNITLTGHPLGLAPLVWLDTADATLMRGLYRDDCFDVVWSLLQAKWLDNMAAILGGDARAAGLGLPAALFIGSLFFRFSDPSACVFRWSFCLGLLLLLVGIGLVGPEALDAVRLFLPLTVLYGIAFVMELVQRVEQASELKVRLVSLLVLVVSASSLVLRTQGAGSTSPYPPYWPPYIRNVCGLLRERELLVTDIPAAAAWYADQPAMDLPVDIDAFYYIHDYIHDIAAIYFTTETRNQPYVDSLMTGPYKTWFPLFEGRIPEDFPLKHGFKLDNLDQLFITDIPRWGVDVSTQ